MAELNQGVPQGAATRSLGFKYVSSKRKRVTQSMVVVVGVVEFCEAKAVARRAIKLIRFMVTVGATRASPFEPTWAWRYMLWQPAR